MLDFSELTEVFPSWTTPPNELYRVEELKHFYDYEPLIKDINCKFRIKNGKLQVDNRSYQSFYRKLSGDSRWKILELIKSLVKTYDFHQDIIKIVIIMSHGCYKNDKKWNKALNEIIPERYIASLKVPVVRLPVSEHFDFPMNVPSIIVSSPMTSGKQQPIIPTLTAQQINIINMVRKLCEDVKSKENTETLSS